MPIVQLKSSVWSRMDRSQSMAAYHTASAYAMHSRNCQQHGTLVFIDVSTGKTDRSPIYHPTLCLSPGTSIITYADGKYNILLLYGFMKIITANMCFKFIIKYVYNNGTIQHLLSEIKYN